MNRDDLQRFVDAQEPVYSAVCAELAAGRKRTHWMWFVFPQLKGLGHSSMAEHYGIAGRREARAYWLHPLLGPRLKSCTDLVLAERRRTVHEIFGSPDDLKLHSCMTLFEAVAPEEPAFGEVLTRFYSGKRDGATLVLLG